jgi:hypothetical protein
MTDYYLSSVDGSDASDGLSWTNAFATFKYAVETASAAASGPHMVLVDSAHSESLSADTTTTLAGNLYVLCVNRSTGALETSAVVGAQATSYSVFIAGAYTLYCYGIKFKTGTATASKNITLGATDGADYTFEFCTLELSTSGTANRFVTGGTSAASSARFVFANCTFKVYHSGAYWLVYGGETIIRNCTLDPAGTSPTYMFILSFAGARLLCNGCDFSDVGSGTLIKDGAGAGATLATFVNCKFGSGMMVREASTTVLNGGQNTTWAFNCNAGDAHYDFYHGDVFGETTVSTTVYANDGASYDGSHHCSWKITTTANCNYFYPYVSPWMDLYYDGTQSLTPYLEILRSGSTTPYKDNEVWSEWSYQGTSGSTKATIVSDRMTPLGTAVNQESSTKLAVDWTGEDATNNWFGKLAPNSAITPAEIGTIRARLCVGATSTTVYVDPTIRGVY